MAQGKKSFVLYTDLLEVAEELTDKEAGLLFKTILRYVNDLNPETPKEIKLAFIPIKQDLKRDLKRYEDKCKKNQENIRKRWNTNEKEKIQSNTNIYDGKNRINSYSVNVNVNDNVNVNVNDNVSSKEDDIYCAEVSEIASTLPAISCPKNHPNGFDVLESDVAKWQEVYLGIDVKYELKKMELWLTANPKSRKTYEGMPRFINSWLSRAQDESSRRNKNTRPSEPPATDGEEVGFKELTYDDIFLNGGGNQ